MREAGGAVDPRVHVNRLEAWPELEDLAPRLEEAVRRALRQGRRRRARDASSGPLAGSPTGEGDPAAGEPSGEGAAPEGAAAEGDEVSITCLSLEEMAELNREHLGRTGPTDVIAFDLGGGGASRESGGSVLGDVYVAPEMALRAAASGEAVSAREEMIRLVVHGVLHVLGFVHPEIDERWDSPMYRLQEDVVASLVDAPPEDG